TFNNSGTLTQQSDQHVIPWYYDFSAPGTINNSGTWVKTSPTGVGVSSIAAVFHNSGIVDVQSGVLQLDKGGVSTGNFNVAARSTLKFGGGTSTLKSGATMTGEGLVQVTGATLVIGANVTAQNFGLLNGTLVLQSTGMLNVGGDFYQAAGTNLVI